MKGLEEKSRGASPGRGLGLATVFSTVCIAALYPGYIGILDHVQGGDITGMHVPYYALLSRAESFGLMWNPYSHCGAPAWGNIGLAQFYPMNMLARWIEPLHLVRVFTYFHLLVLSISIWFWTSIYFRAWPLRLGVIFLTLFSFSTRSLMEFGHLTILTSIAWFPLFLFFLHQALTYQITNLPSRRFWLGLSVIIGLWLLGGHPQFLYLSALIGGVQILVISYHYSFRRTPEMLLRYSLALGLGVGLAWIQVAGTIESLPLTNRAASSGEAAFLVEGVLSPANLLKAVWPQAWGWTDSHYGPYHFWFGNIYIGSALFIGLAGLFFYKKCLSRNALWIPGLLCFIFALGPLGILYSLMLEILPGLKSFRYPSRSLYFSSILFLPLIVIGIRAIISRGISRNLSVVLTFTLGGFLLWSAFPELLPSLLEPLLPQHVIERKRSMPVSDPSVSWWVLTGDVGMVLGWWCLLGRSRRRPLGLLLLVCGGGIAVNAIPSPSTSEEEMALRPNRGFPRMYIMEKNSAHNHHLIKGYSSPGGYDSLSLARFRSFLDTSIEQDWSKHTREQLHSPDHPIWRMLNVGRFPKAVSDLDRAEELEQSSHKGLYFLTSDFSWPARENHPETRNIRDHQNQLKMDMESLGYDFSRDPDGKVDIISYETGRVELKVISDSDAVLASSENTTDSWSVFVNGKKATISKWLDTFRAVPIKAGETTIVYEYDRSNFYASSYISLFFLMFILLGFLMPTGVSHSRVFPFFLRQ